ncbi:dihydroneopterin aldolase [Aureimonas sp. AU40]|uniref:dihydroneopterin aldolase n=1 Tax=Aureimonas sp. AU40 TaxID=1637747 RepID=UPI000781DFC9|nr:dihydroneopterin aldolase [Aureimonas sp. AU40]
MTLSKPPCRFAIAVRSPEEARRALEAGADYVLAPARRDRPGAAGTVERRGDGQPELYFAMAGDVTLPADPLRVARLEAPDEFVGVLRGGYSVVLLDPDRALLRAFSLETLAEFQRACREAGLECWFGGRLELPDIPRLLVLAPDALVFEELDAETLATGRRMLSTPAAPLAPEREALETDRIFVRGFTLPFRVGAYRFERDRSQRLRFTVEAEVRRPSRTPREVSEVYSYDIVTDAIRRLADQGHTDLVEALAEDLAADLLGDGRLLSVEIQVEKLDLGPEAVGVVIRRRREDRGF